MSRSGLLLQVILNSQLTLSVLCMLVLLTNYPRQTARIAEECEQDGTLEP